MAAASLVVCLGVLLSLKSKLGMSSCPTAFILTDTCVTKVKVVPHENVLPKAIQVLTIAARDGFKLDNAKRDYQMQKHGRTVPWDDEFVKELKQGLVACRVM